MKGSVRKRYNNAWSYRIDLGFVDGKRKQVEKGGFKTEREATKAMQDVLYHLNNTGDYVENKKVSFHTVYEEFIEREGKATRAYATLKKYDSLYRNHIKDEFGPLYVYQISDTMIIDFLNQKRIKYSEEYVKGMTRWHKPYIAFPDANGRSFFWRTFWIGQISKSESGSMLCGVRYKPPEPKH